ncbi:MAG: MarR family transcriptional regulator, partial [Cetobacterium sp.]
MELELKNTIGRYIGCLSRKSHLFLTKELAIHKCEIAPGQLSLLMLLYSEGGIRQDSISLTLNLDKGNTTKSIKKLEELGLIFRIKDSTDKR